MAYLEIAHHFSGPVKKRPKTAAELLAELNSDPVFVTREREREDQRLRDVEHMRKIAAPVIAELAALGFEVATISELRQRGVNYASAVPVLLKWLPAIFDPGVKESLVRALSMPFAQSAAPVLVEEFRRASAAQVLLKWAIGNALSVVADEAVFDDVAELVRDQRHGKAREILAVALGNMSTPTAVVVLSELLQDDEVAGHAIIGLGNLRATAARGAIEGFLRAPQVVDSYRSAESSEKDRHQRIALVA